MSKFVLPSGWEREKLRNYNGDIFTLINEQVSVTVNYDNRMFALGAGPFNNHNNKATKKYTGRGWRDQLASDAIKYLEEIMSCPNF